MTGPHGTKAAGEAAGAEGAAAGPPTRMAGHLRLPGAVALAITIVVGSGALVSPGIAYHQTGQAALYAWLVAAAVTVPLLIVFARLGADLPGAGGVAGFVQAGFGRSWAAGVEVMLLGTFGLGIPAIALTGGFYFQQIPGLHGVPAWAAAIGLLALAGVSVAIGGSVSSRIQIVLALLMTAGLLAAAVLGLSGGDPVQHLPPARPEELALGVAALGAVFFAFTGWEMLSFTTEEYANPRRDFPRVVVISFLVVTTLYVLLAWAVQTRLAEDDPKAASAPIHAVVSAAAPGLAWVVSVLGVVIIAANLVGAVWAASRLVMSSAREGLLPRPLARLSRSAGTPPRNAVAVCVAVFSLMALATASDLLSLSDLLTVAGQNFFLLYLFSAVVYARLKAGAPRVFGITIAVLLGLLALTFGPLQLGYALVLLMLGWALSRRGGNRREAAPGS
ncbi:APC family permease [Streptomyces atacamensis]|uniref:APC family permease n=1 Tax=Streptomyces atacamensis TaxID=531966 RepID=UPI00399C70C8